MLGERLKDAGSIPATSTTDRTDERNDRTTDRPTNERRPD